MNNRRKIILTIRHKRNWRAAHRIGTTTESVAENRCDAGLCSQRPAILAFLNGLRQSGYVDRQDHTDRIPAGRRRAPRGIGRGDRANEPQLIFAPIRRRRRRSATPTTMAIVTAALGDPIKAGLAASLAHPGGNVTGLTALGSGLSGKRVELLKEMVPRLTRVAVLWNPAVPDKTVNGKKWSRSRRRSSSNCFRSKSAHPPTSTAHFENIKRLRPQALIALGEPLVCYTTRARHRIHEQRAHTRDVQLA